MVAFILAVVGALIAAFAPLGREMGTTGYADGTTVTWSLSVSIFQTDGAWVLVVVSVPVLLTLLPLIVHRRGARVITAVLLWVCCVIGLFSVGMFFVPAAIAMTVAAARREPVPAPAA